MPSVTCSLLPSPPLAAGTTWLPLIVTLKVHDSLGNTADAVNRGARIFPHGVCGF